MEVKRKTADGKTAIFDSATKKFLRFDQPAPGPMAKGLSSYMAFMGKEGGYGSNPAGKAMDLVRKPFEKAGEATTEALGKRQVNPYLSAGIGTAMQMAPDIAMSAGHSGTERPYVPNKLRVGAFKQLESASGSMPGSLEKAYQDPTAILAKGKEAAGALYNAARAKLPEGASVLQGMSEPKQIIDAAQEYMSKGGKLEPAEALMYRKALSKLIKKPGSVIDELLPMKDAADKMAKADQGIATADKLHARGMAGESLRNILPQNKAGGASAFKMGIAPALTALGGALGGPEGAGLGGALAAGTLSPAVQGVSATLAGMGTRAAKAALSSPGLVATVIAALREQQKRSKPNPNENINP